MALEPNRKPVKPPKVTGGMPVPPPTLETLWLCCYADECAATMASCNADTKCTELP